MEPRIDALAELLERARSALFITGAGVSADSGLPTYRGVGGLYERGETEEGVPIEVALSGDMLRARPEIAWKYIHQIDLACRGGRPNAAHEVIAKLEQRLERAWVLTQNVDGFHTDAGSRNVIEMHGSRGKVLCTACGWHEEVHDYTAYDGLFAGTPRAPRCPQCDAVLRPAVVLFGEMLPPAAVQTMEREMARGFDVVLSIGTSSAFPYIVAPVVHALRQGIPTVEINPGDTELSELVDLRIRERAAPVFEAVWRRLGG